MGREISLFSGYSQKENRTTNYCLLVLRMLYQENPQLLAEALGALVGEEQGLQVGVTFQQQVARPGSTPDGRLFQPAFTIYLETKNFDWFHDAQLESHLDALAQEQNGLKVLLALSNFSGPQKSRFNHISQLCDTKYKGQIAFEAISFEQFVEAITFPDLSIKLRDTVADFESYLNDNGLLPRWKYRLDVVQCKHSHEDIRAHNTYICPPAGGPYSHKQSQFFGLFLNTGIQAVARIRGVVDLNIGPPSVYWNNDKASGLLSGLSDTALIQEAQARLAPMGVSSTTPARVFILEQLQDVTPGQSTMYVQGKTYLDIRHLPNGATEDASELATQLLGIDWSVIPKLP